MSGKQILGFIGTGVMGASMAGHLLAAGHELHVYNRTKNKADALVTAGAVWESSPADVAAKCNIVFTIIGFPKDVEEIYLGEKGLLASAKKGAMLVDMTTSSPKLAKEIWEEGKKRGVRILDAPVTGGDTGARNATLTIFVGGTAKDFAYAKPYFDVMGKNICHMGKAGAGQCMKLANQTALAGAMMGMCEGLAFAKASGLDQQQVLDALASGSAGSTSIVSYGPRILRGDFEPGFFIKHYIKDMKLAVKAAEEADVDVPAIELALELYSELADAELENKGTQTLYALYDPAVLHECETE